MAALLAAAEAAVASGAMPAARAADAGPRLLSHRLRASASAVPVSLDAIACAGCERWDAESAGVPRFGGFARGVWMYDGGLFGSSAGECVLMDPQQRVLLVEARGALACGGLLPLGWACASVGVFVGTAGGFEHSGLWERAGYALTPYSSTSAFSSVACGRLSFTCGFQGPCASVDTACSSSLVATHVARCALSQDECAAGVAAGVHRNLKTGRTSRYNLKKK